MRENVRAWAAREGMQALPETLHKQQQQQQQQQRQHAALQQQQQFCFLTTKRKDGPFCIKSCQRWLLPK